MPPRITSSSKRQYIQILEDKFNDIYDYSLAEYTGYAKKIKIIHKATQIVFEQRYDYHFNGKPSSSLEFNFILYIEKCIEKFNNRFKYSDYKGYNKHVTIYDTMTGISYSQIAQEHYEEESTPRYLKEYLSDFNVFKNRAENIHKGIFEYLNYNWTERRVTFKHLESGVVYTQNLYDHVKGSLPKELVGNAISKGERKLREFVESKFQYYEILYNKRFKFLDGKELDIYIPSFNLAFEYNGTVCHHSNFDIADYFARERAKPITYHLDKFNDCLNNGIKLIHIFDFEEYDLNSLIDQYLSSDLKVIENKAYYLSKRLKPLKNFSSKSTYVVYKPIVSFINTPS